MISLYIYLIYIFFYLIRGAEVSDCGNWLIVTPLKDCRDNLVYFTPLKAGMDISNNLPLTQVVDKLEADYEVSNKYLALKFMIICNIFVIPILYIFSI